jgi:UDP-N-acetyl-D-mannosaminuronic acid dehydrogenase
MLQDVVGNGALKVSTRPDGLADARFVVLIVGTPVDKYLNPDLGALYRALDPCLPHLRDGQTLILRSTVYPGTSRKIQDHLLSKGLDVHVAFCPERTVQGYAVRELRELPQIISAFTEPGFAGARRFFEPISPSLIELAPLEAELAKLFANASRYIEFATVNQFYMIAQARGVDYYRIHRAIKQGYPRLAHLPGPGFAAGPCLLKDTMQLGAFNHGSFVLGQAAMMVNEGLPYLLVQDLKRRYCLAEMTVGVLGMAFKPNSDDSRASLSYKLRKILLLECRRVLCTDPYVLDPELAPLDQVLAEADLLVVGAPHDCYRGLAFRQPVIDITASIRGEW